MDLTRVAGLVIVVVGHLLMLGASVAGDHRLVVQRTLTLQPWFTPVTWVAQVMPLFFVVGGFAGALSWRRVEARGGTAAVFIRARVLRLAWPTLPLFAFLALAILAMHLAGLGPDTVAEIATGVVSPLWFLAAYTFCQAFLPGMATLHARAPIRLLICLAGAMVSVDALRLGTHTPELGLLNMTFVWLFVQQLGLWAADGWFGRRRRRLLVALAGASYALLGLLTTVGPYPANMLDNLNPPTTALAVLAVGQFSALMALRPQLDRLARSAFVRRVVAGIGTRMMTVYLWHLPVLGLIVGAMLLLPMPEPAPGGAGWWLTRPLVLLVAVGALVGVAALFGRFEHPAGSPADTAVAVRDWRVGVSTALMIVPPFTIMLFGLNLGIAVTSEVLLAAAVFLQSPVRLGEDAGQGHEDRDQGQDDRGEGQPAAARAGRDDTDGLAGERDADGREDEPGGGNGHGQDDPGQ
ncbi:fucose 4-O-acetylase-like acetyltransferase [Cryobacterium sp. MP_M5]|uniref:acyltransferase family protein n=1 Tax=unclassified Cryobacterium TaxID=2649013 RepID=UPI0018C99E1F|nr:MULTISPECIES: acyltransferase [unclassified Cryobacterium]MBG6059815.1 fucose 4-O-acetylase-like acetyltransferase [Cryobacterium sp. MP_M3]MEC5178187.1 fucose 4-O-acetylase-like acetyltransferase [Cryobacterium sp. MP_M5]